jgi:CubicO group peptidase (beta-lactamase class C family)
MHARKAVAIVVMLVVAVGCGRQQASHRATEVGDDNPAIDALFASWDRPGSPGCALAVTQDGKPLYTRGYGYANLDHDIPITPQTVFDVGSVTKQFVAASISMLELEGKLSLDDDVRKWLPELPDLGKPVTLRHMVYHTSGLRDYLTLFPLAGRDHYYPISHVRILDMMSRQRALIFPPGERHLYSNTAYMLLAQVVERAGGKTLGEFAQERMFEPLGMKDSQMYDNREEIIARRATGYDRHGDDDIRMVHNYNFDVAGDGQLYTTVEDLLRWDDYLHGVRKPAIHAAMLTEGRLDNGEPTKMARGLVLGTYRDQLTIHHTGSSWGFQSVLMRFVDAGMGIAIACNDGFADPEQLAHRVADHYLADRFSAGSDERDRVDERTDAIGESSSPTPGSPQLAEFTGAYFSAELDATYRFAVVGDRLLVRIGQDPPLAVVPVADDRFLISFAEQAYSGVVTANLAFDRSASGIISGFSLSSGTEQGLVFEKQR